MKYPPRALALAIFKSHLARTVLFALLIHTAFPILTADAGDALMGPLQQGAKDLKFQHGEIEWLSSAGREAYVMVPHQADAERRWVWIAPMWLGVVKDKNNPLPSQVEYEWYIERLLERGFHVVGLDVGTSLGSPAGAQAFEDFYDLIQSRYHLHPKARMVGQSNGGLIASGWAFRHPEKVDRIVGIYPAFDMRSWPGLNKVVGPESMGDSSFGYGKMTREELEKRLPELNPIDNLKPLADAKVKLFLIHGDADSTVPFEPNSGEAKRRYQQFGGNIEVVPLKGFNHQPGPGFYDSQQVVDFLIQ